MRRRLFGENGEILTRTELIAQALRFLRPYLSQARPERFDEIHLVAVLDNAAAQIVQVFCLSVGPGIRHQLSSTPICRRQPIRHNIEVDGLERPPFERKCCVVEVAREPIAHGFGEALGFGRVTHFRQSRANSFNPSANHSKRREPIERRELRLLHASTHALRCASDLLVRQEGGQAAA